MSWWIESSEVPLQAKQMIEVDVKPCPFCGSNDRLVITKRENFEKLVDKNGSSMISIECRRCDLEFKDYDHENSKDYDFLRMRIVRRWNERKEATYADQED